MEDSVGYPACVGKDFQENIHADQVQAAAVYPRGQVGAGVCQLAAIAPSSSWYY